MAKQKLENKVEAPFTENVRYTYADYLTWHMEELVELIRGKVFRQAEAPRVIHQRIAGNVSKIFTHGDRVASQAVVGFVLDLEEIFYDMI